jgi:hypothetical protein
MWSCPKCGNKVDPSFEVCWACGTTPDGVEDPSFVTAEEAGRIDEPPVEPAPVDADLPAAELDPDVHLVECYWAMSVQEAKFLADQLIEQGIPAAADEQNLRYYLAGLPLGPYFGPRVWVRAEDLPRAHAWLEQFDKERTQHPHFGLMD